MTDQTILTEQLASLNYQLLQGSITFSEYIVQSNQLAGVIHE